MEFVLTEKRHRWGLKEKEKPLPKRHNSVQGIYKAFSFQWCIMAKQTRNVMKTHSKLKEILYFFASFKVNANPMCFTHRRRKSCLSLVSNARPRVILREVKQKNFMKTVRWAKYQISVCGSVELLAMLWVLLSMETNIFIFFYIKIEPWSPLFNEMSLSSCGKQTSAGKQCPVSPPSPWFLLGVGGKSFAQPYF